MSGPLAHGGIDDREAKPRPRLRCERGRLGRGLGWLLIVGMSLNGAPGSAVAQVPSTSRNATPPTDDGTPTARIPAPASSAPAASGPGAEEDEVSPERKREARRRFGRGLELLREEAWAPALAEFLRSRALFPTRVATNNAAVALRRLQRYDEALDMYETLLRDFQVSEVDRKAAQEQIATLRQRVGTIDIVGAEPGAAIVIGGLERGEFPPVKALRVPAGDHVVRLYKEGYERFEARIDVAGGEIARVEATMVALTASGRLRVVEPTGKAVTVVVDNVAVGLTPWEGDLAVGDHVVRLVGPGKLGSQPARASVTRRGRTVLRLRAEPLAAQLRVEPTPAGAAVFIDGVEVGNGAWLGRLKDGRHRVVVKAPGFLDATRSLTLEPGVRRRLDVELERDDDAPMWRKPARWVFDGSMGFVAVPSFGGALAETCAEGCREGTGLGGMAMLQANYELGSGLGFGIEAGYVLASQAVTGRTAELSPIGFSDPTIGTANDDLRLQAFLAGGTLGYHLGDRVPVVLRLGAGILVGEVRDQRQGTFATRRGSTFNTFPVVAFPRATYFYVDPMARVGYRFADHFEISAFVRALLWVNLETPRFDDTLEVAADTDGIGTFVADDVMGSFIVGAVPGVNLRYDFE
ncbi:MAG: PEGA domain-containing protein [Myxococcota bacterium]